MQRIFVALITGSLLFMSVSFYRIANETLQLMSRQEQRLEQDRKETAEAIASIRVTLAEKRKLDEKLNDKLLKDSAELRKQADDNYKSLPKIEPLDTGLGNECTTDCEARR